MIHRLSQNLINQIAAGEVVVRPASVVKELVENAIDAEARTIRVSVENENRNLSVSDDGCGIELTEATLALQRHTTSKIQRPADLNSIVTRGFRGEALASIAAVSKLELLSRQAEALVGARVVVWGGDLQKQEQTGGPNGTTITVRDLFYNTPARLKFMKSVTSEWRQISQIVIRQALGSPSIGFRLENNGKVNFDLPPEQNLRDRFVQLAGPSLNEQLLEVNYERAGLHIEGFIGHPAAGRKDRRHQYFYVNRRPISSRPLSFSLQQAYHGLLMTQRFPVALLFINLYPAEVDINVHPTKEEIRFRDERKVAGLLNRAVVASLEASDLKPTLNINIEGGVGEPHKGTLSTDSPAQQDLPGFEHKKPDYQSMFSEAARRLYLEGERTQTPGQALPVDPPETESKAVVPDQSAQPETAVRQEDSSTTRSPGTDIEPPEDLRGLSVMPRAIGQLAETYIIASADDELLLIDQHAAHERLLFLRLLDQPEKQQHIQPLMVPVPLEIAPADIPLIEELAPALHALGFEIEPFGGATYIVNSQPAELGDIDAERLIRDLLDDMDREGKPSETRKLKEAVAAKTACHAAIRAGQRLQPEEMDRLIADLYTTPTTYTCPHGRPTIIRLTKDNLDKQFGRKG